jgi:hypothetical protein
MLWTFSMRRVDVGRLLLSAWQEVMFQRRHCRTKDWPYSQAARTSVRMLLCFEMLMLQDGVMWELGGACVARKEARFDVLEMNADAMRMSRWWCHWCEQCCGRFRWKQWTLDDCCSQCGKIRSCSDVTAEPRIGHIRRRPDKQYVFYIVLRVVDIARWCDVGVGGGLCCAKGGAL